MGEATYLLGSYNLAIGRLRPGRWASQVEQEAIVYLAASDGFVRAEQIGFDLALERQKTHRSANMQRGYYLLRTLVSLGIAIKPSPDRYQITERGRIAAALIMMRHPGMLWAFFDDVPEALPSAIEPTDRGTR